MFDNILVTQTIIAGSCTRQYDIYYSIQTCHERRDYILCLRVCTSWLIIIQALLPDAVFVIHEKYLTHTNLKEHLHQ